MQRRKKEKWRKNKERMQNMKELIKANFFIFLNLCLSEKIFKYKYETYVFISDFVMPLIEKIWGYEFCLNWITGLNVY